jgi:hypothetical protein
VVSPGFNVYGLMPEVFIEERLNVRSNIGNRKKAGHWLAAFGTGFFVLIPPGDQILDPAVCGTGEIVPRHTDSMSEKGRKRYATMIGVERC